MALPTQDDLKTLDYQYFGQPFCWLSLKSTLDTDTLDYQYFGQPFWGTAYKLTVDSGSFALIGSDVTLKIERKLAVDNGAFSLTGTPVTFGRNYVLSLEPGIYILNGTDIGLYWWMWNACRGYVIPQENRVFAIPACDYGGK